MELTVEDEQTDAGQERASTSSEAIEVAQEVGAVDEEIEVSFWRQYGPRLALLAALLVGTYVVGTTTGLTEQLTIENIRTTMTTAGAWGLLAFLGAFMLGNLLQVPGLVFVIAAIVAYGRVAGWAVGLGGALLAVSSSFWVVRLVGGRPLGAITHPWMRKLLGRLGDQPIRSIVLLRLFFLMSPPVNYALAMTDVRYRDYLVGSLLGLLAPLTLLAIFVEWAMETLV
jgi:uncharacterized membrane protein YdjX (TVP38/TMEM64 family)